MGSDEIKSKSHDELYMKSIQKIMPGDIENGITFISIDEIEAVRMEGTKGMPHMEKPVETADLCKLYLER